MKYSCVSMDMAISSPICSFSPRSTTHGRNGEQECRHAETLLQYRNLGWKASSFAGLPSTFLQHNQGVADATGRRRSAVVLSRADGRSQVSTVASPPPFPPPQPQIGSPLLWIGVGVGLSVLFSWAARRVQSYAMQQALKTMMQQTGQAVNPFAAASGSGYSTGQDFSPLVGGHESTKSFGGIQPGLFPSPASSQPSQPPQPPQPPQPSQPSSASAESYSTSTATMVDFNASPSPPQVEESVKPKKSAFVDVDIDLIADQETLEQEQPLQQPVAGGNNIPGQDGYGKQGDTTDSGKKSFISLEMLEQMLDDPKVQKMVLPYLPEQMRDPVTFKQMIQLPFVRKQLQEALNNIDKEDGMDMLKYMNSDVVKQQFEQMGITPEEAVGKILASPEVSASLQKPKVLEAIMDCSQNPINITKYQNDKEVMDALLKIAELFPGGS